MALGLGIGLAAQRKRAAAIDAAIQTLFAGSDPGFWFDPSDFSTMWQDTAGTVAVTATGQSVARIDDKSGGANHLTQATAASRPTLQQDGNGKYYLSFDGTDDGLASTATVNLTAGDAMCIGAGVHKVSDAARAVLVELSATISTNNGAFSIEAPNAAAATNYKGNSKGTVEAPKILTTFAAGNTHVLIQNADISLDQMNLRVNGVDSTVGSDQGTGNYGNYTLFVGRRNNSNLPFNGRLYGLLGILKTVSAQEITDIEDYLAAKSGISF